MTTPQEASRAAFEALEDVIPPHLRATRHGDGFLGQRYDTLHAYIMARDAECLALRNALQIAYDELLALNKSIGWRDGPWQSVVVASAVLKGEQP